MEYELYADVWFLTNFVMDCIALEIAGRLMKQRIRFRSLVLAGIAGSAGSLILFLLMRRYLWYQLLVHLIINPLMIWICFRCKRVREFLAEWVMTYLSMILLGGAMEWSAANVGVRYFWICLFAASVFLWSAEKILAYFRRQKDTIYDLLLITRQGKIPAKGFFDTGNLLVDPIVGKPVHIIKKEMLQGQVEQGQLLVRMIPFHSLGRDHGLLEAVTIEGMYIFREDQPLYLEKPILGLAKENLFQDDRCQVILNGKSMEY